MVNKLFINESGILTVSKGDNEQKSSLYTLIKDCNGNFGINQNKKETLQNMENVKKLKNQIKSYGR